MTETKAVKKTEEKHAEKHEKKEVKSEQKHEPKHEAKEVPKSETHIEHKTEAKEHKTEAKEHKSEAKETKAKKPKAKKPAKKDSKVFVARGKRKLSIARATIQAGKGVVRFNKQKIGSLSNKYVQEIVLEPLSYVGPVVNDVDIDINVIGGGMMGQAQAARTAVANALVLYFSDMNLKEKFVEIDRTLVVEDTRRVESKKFRGPKARARFQKSYR